MVGKLSRINKALTIRNRKTREGQSTAERSASGSFDGIVGGLIAGWLDVPPNSDPTVTLMFGNECISKTYANIQRSDLAELGYINGRGYVFSTFEVENQLRKIFEINMQYSGRLTIIGSDGATYFANGSPMPVEELLCILSLCYASLVMNANFSVRG